MLLSHLAAWEHADCSQQTITVVLVFARARLLAWHPPGGGSYIKIRVPSMAVKTGIVSIWLTFGAEQGRSQRRNCWDNAMAASLRSSLKKERIRKRSHKIRDHAKADMFDGIEVFTTVSDAILISVSSVQRRLKRPPFKAGVCDTYW